MNTLNPKFKESILVDYYFERIQELQFKLLDIDNKKKGLTEGAEDLGMATTRLGDVSLYDNGDLRGFKVADSVRHLCSLQWA